MLYNILGKTGFNVSRIGFGGIPIQHVEQKNVNDIMSKAIDSGINFLDTARGYTISEELLGNALIGKRDKMFLATKSMARDKEGMLSDVRISLDNLKTDYIDLYQLHNISTEEDLEFAISEKGVVAALLGLQKEGLIKKIGITSHKLPILEEALKLDIFDTIQFPFSAVERQGEEVFKKAAEKNVGTIAMKPMAGGALRDGRKALKYILDSPYLNVAIPGMDCIEQVIINAEAADGIRLTEEERQEIEKIAKELGNTFCRRCGYCMPCSIEMNIPMMFILESYFTRYDLKDWSASRYKSFDVKAKDCIKCGICESRCPYELPIRDMLDNVAKVFK